MGSSRQAQIVLLEKTMTKKRLAKKKKIVNSDFSDDNSTKDGIITPHGSTAGGRSQWWHLYGLAYHPEYVDQAPVTSHRALGTRHLHQALVNQSPVTRHQSPVTSHHPPRHLSLSGEHQAPVQISGTGQ